MLNSTRVLNYVKDNLGFPFMHLEWDDEKIIEYIQSYTLGEFSHYFPEVRALSVDLTLTANKVPGRSNEFYIVEPEGREILSVSDILFNSGNLMMFGHPPMGALSMGDLKEWALDVSVAGMIKMFSSYDYTHEFKHPNIVRISPVPNNVQWVTIEYERVQSSDFRGVPNDIRHFFLELALADIMIAIGRIRKRYGGGSLRTPFGEIPLDSEIYEEGKEKKREVLEKLTIGSYTNVIIDHG